MTEVTIARAAKRAGVPLPVLRGLCDEGVVPVVRDNRRHLLVPVDAIPNRAVIREVLFQRYRAHLTAAQEAGRRAQAELEAIRLDIDAAAQHPDVTPVLGNDVRAASVLADSLTDLQRASLSVALLHRQLCLIDEDDPAL